MDTAELLEQGRSAIVERALASIRQTHLVHYERSDPGEVRGRVEALVDRLLESVDRRDLRPMVDHASSLADARFGAGFDLSEVQAAMNAVEEAAWAVIIEDGPPAQLPHSLSLVTGVLGAGKDAVARAYVSMATKSRASILDLDALFAWTVSA